jgi:hypothetical protein
MFVGTVFLLTRTSSSSKLAALKVSGWADLSSLLSVLSSQLSNIKNLDLFPPQGISFKNYRCPNIFSGPKGITENTSFLSFKFVLRMIDLLMHLGGHYPATG